MSATDSALSAMRAFDVSAPVAGPVPYTWPRSVVRHESVRRASGVSTRGARALAFALALSVHAGGLYALTRMDWKPVQVAGAPLQVALIAPQASSQVVEAPPGPPQIEPLPPAPKPVPPAPQPKPKPKPKPKPPEPVVTESPTAISTAADPEPAPEEDFAPAAPTAPVAAAPAPAVQGNSGPVGQPGPSGPVVSEARFDADYLNNPPPIYPPLSRRMREEGRVMLRVHVAANGSPTTVELNTSSGSNRLDTAALNAVQRWRFAPARRGERAVDAWVLVPIVFKLEGS